MVPISILSIFWYLLKLCMWITFHVLN